MYHTFARGPVGREGKSADFAPGAGPSSAGASGTDPAQGMASGGGIPPPRGGLVMGLLKWAV
ncbi:MAG TPA: hypothetical protein VH092_18110, partial [Urbifossiella sp.]|nr:hypothetical protein [Urbifossiella sp.]